MERLFFGFEVLAPWQDPLPQGRILEESSRHITLAFLGEHPLPSLIDQTSSLPQFSAPFGFGGIFDAPLFLPERRANVVAYHAVWERDEKVTEFKNDLLLWLESLKIFPRKWDNALWHLTMARAPLDKKHWKTTFTPIPFILKGFHLYQSHPDLRYEKKLSFSFPPPFYEVEHTKDTTFHIIGEDFQALAFHAKIALGFRFPKLTRYISFQKKEESQEELIGELNRAIQNAKIAEGVPLKAVSYHGELIEMNGGLFWEMMCDVLL